MNKVLISIGVISAISIGVWLVVSGDNDISSDSAGSTIKVAREQDQELTRITGSINDLIRLNKNLKCDFVQDSGNSNMEGTFYITKDGKKVRGDFTVNTQGLSMSASTIKLDDVIYTWGESPYGKYATKVKVGEKVKKGKSINFDEEMGFSCSEWRIDNSKFKLPKDLNFEDINPQVQKIDKIMNQVDDLRCGACKDLQDPNSKAQCLAAMGCQ